MNTSYSCGLIDTLSYVEDWLSEESEQPDHFSQSLAEQMNTHLESDCIHLRAKVILSCAPKKERNALIALRVVTGVLFSYLNAKPFCLFTVNSHPQSKTTLKRLQYYFQCFLVS